MYKKLVKYLDRLQANTVVNELYRFRLAFDLTNLATLEFVTHILPTTDSKKFTIGFFGILRKRLTELIMKY